VPDRYPAIEDHAVAGNLHTAALVATDETIDWCCLPRFDLPAVFASLLDADRGSSFAVQCAAARTRQLPGWPVRACPTPRSLPAAYEPAHLRIPPAQGLHQARHQLPKPAACRPGQPQKEEPGQAPLALIPNVRRHGPAEKPGCRLGIP
jgi:Domain of unknown function (DUF5911)